MNDLFIYDTTLRDGEQMPGVVFSRDEKIELAKKMSDFGVGIIGIMPAVSNEERETAEYLSNCGLKSQITAATKMSKDDIDIAVDCGVDRVILFSSVSDIHLDKKLRISRGENLKRSVEYVNYALEKGLNVDFAGEDASRADEKYLVDFVNSLNGIDYFLPCDTSGIWTPDTTKHSISFLKKETNCKIGLHNHNDLGQAVANTLAGIEAGADLFSGTFNGIGERAGNASIEEVVLSLMVQYERRLPVRYDMLYEICGLVEKYSRVSLQKHKAISGRNAFVHESGLHVDAMIKDSRSYENFDPREIGREREFVAGKHSGKSLLRYWFGDGFSDKEYDNMLKKIKDLSTECKTIFTRREVLDLLAGDDDLFDGL